MSKIQEELAGATEVTPSKRKNETITTQDYLKRLAVAILELEESAWNRLSPDAQAWYNSAADAIEAKKDIPDFPDMATSGGTRRRGAAAETPAKYEPKEGDEVVITTKRGKTVVGKLAVVDNEGYQLEDGQEFGPDVTVELNKSNGGGDEAEPEDDDLGEPEVGATVQIETKRGKVIMGKVKELDDEGMLLVDSTGAEHDITIASTKSIVVKAKASADKPSGRRGAASDDKKADDKKPAAAGKPPSVTLRVREIMVDSLKGGGKLISKDDLSKAIKAEGFADAKQSTLDLTYNDTAKTIELIRAAKLID